ncbi:MAG: AbiJ-NTD4 domain-containing protein [Syntrophobacteraceae bacterium]
MLTDIFAYRYENTPIWQTFGEPERRLLVQTFKIVSEQLYPYWKNGKEDPASKAKWTLIHDRLCMELGLSELSQRNYAYQTTLYGQQIQQAATHSMDYVCKAFVCAEYNGAVPSDRFMKERISFVEIAFRERGEEIKGINANLERNVLLLDAFDSYGSKLGDLFPSNKTDELRSANQSLNDAFKASVEELNERFRRSGCGLNYHNGFIQQSSDELTKDQVEVPFWELLSGEIWKNVDYDIKDAIDKRDNGVRDPALYAAKALESTIKIISEKNGWTRGNERGAHNFIDNLRGGNLIDKWESDALKHFFTFVRNPFGHGAGSAEMPELSPQQTDWAIEYCMSWIKSLIKRA